MNINNPNMAYTDPKEYRKFLKTKCSETEHSDSESCKDCAENKDCSCCPIGTIAVYDENGLHQGCLNAQDYEENKINTHICEDGFLKLYQGLKFIGCVPSTEFAALYTSLN